MREMITLPGIGGSGETHWQSLWEKTEPHMRRFSPSNWDVPDLEDWIEALDREVEKSAAPPILVAHSLSCLLVAHWSARTKRTVAGALLVAPPDPASSAFPAEAAGFAQPPMHASPFPSLIIASGNDPYGSLTHARSLAARWGSGLIDVGPHGHLNGSSGLGDWPQGRAALAAFEANLG